VAVHAAREPIREHAPLQDLVLLVSLALVLVGIAGFIPGITTHYSDLEFAGNGSGAELFGTFQVSILLNLLHLLLGLAGLALARTADGARAFLIGGGLLNLLLALYGVLTPQDSSWNFIPLDRDDDILHLSLGAGMFAFGVLPERLPGRPGETLAGFLAAASIFVSAVGVAYRPLRLVPLAILLALLAAAIGGRSARLAMIAASVGALCFVLGMAFAVVTSHPLW
jgi:hypothetical protein